MRAGKGLFISADSQEKAGGDVLAMESTIQQLNNAIGLAQSIMNLAKNSNVEISDHE
ncbi:hypothetical protein CKA49_34470, partial [Pseudomonas aeruginosa]